MISLTRFLSTLIVFIMLPGCVVLPPSLSTSDETESAEFKESEIRNRASKFPEQKKNLKLHAQLKAREEIHASILAFADRYMERIAQVSDVFISSEITAMDREFIQSMRVAYVTSAIAIATETKPLSQLLDMYIMVYLQLSVWEDMKDPFLLKYKEQMVSTLQTLKISLSRIAYKAFSIEDIKVA